MGFNGAFNGRPQGSPLHISFGTLVGVALAATRRTEHKNKKEKRIELIDAFGGDNPTRICGLTRWRGCTAEQNTKKRKHASLLMRVGGDNRTRICDLPRVRRTLYRLSYASIWTAKNGGDPDGNRTRVTAVKGRCLDRLTTGPLYRTDSVRTFKSGSGNWIRTSDTTGMNRVL